MATDYKIVLRSVDGTVKLAESVNFLSLAYSKRVREPGMGRFVLASNNPIIALLSDMTQVEIWRRNKSMALPWYCDFYGFYREPLEETQADSTKTFTGSFAGQMSLLGRRIVNWYATTANRSDFATAKAETIMKTLVSYNIGAAATVVNGRLRAGVLSGKTISIEADGARGNTVSWACAYDNLLVTLQGLAKVAGGDFGLVKTAASTWEFRWYTGQLGTDRHASVVFSTSFDNMAEPSHRITRMDESTVAVVAGGGVDSARTVVTRTGVNYSATNDIEEFVDRRDTTVAAEMNASGDEANVKAQARDEFAFTIRQTPNLFYGKHYFLGDLAQVRYLTTSKTQKLVGVSVAFDAQQDATIPERVEVEVADA